MTSELRSQNERWSTIAREIKLQSPIETKWWRKKQDSRRTRSPGAKILSKNIVQCEYGHYVWIRVPTRGATGKLDNCDQLTQETGFLPRITQLMGKDILGRPSIFVLYFVHKSFRRFTQFGPQSIAQHFSLLGTTTVTNEQFNYNDISLFLYGWSSDALGPRTHTGGHLACAGSCQSQQSYVLLARR